VEHKRFFGLHFDFHAAEEEVGTRTVPEDIEWYINEAKPDFIQCDSKGHEGNSSYPTKVGYQAPNIKSDNLRVWSDVAKKTNTPLYVHYSGVWDGRYVEAHPEEAVVNENGESRGRASLFGRYCDDLLIPQVKEMITEYGISGIWVDGDCWAVDRDFSENAKPHLWEGITEEEHKQVMRDAFYKYVQHYAEELHKFAPDFKVASNWMYTSGMLEKPVVDVDFLSGDYNHNDSVHTARIEGRSMAMQNKPWDLMAWGFEWTHFAEKPLVQLEQEAAAVLMLGGGFQLYTTQNRDGSARRNRSPKLRKLAEFVRAREINFEKKLISQVGVFASLETFYKKNKVFVRAGMGKPMEQMPHAILDAQYTTNTIPQYQIDTLKNYEIVVVPEWEYISDGIKNQLLDYAKDGGNLLIVGAECCSQFGKLCGFDFGEVKTVDGAYVLDDDGCFMAVNVVGMHAVQPVDVLDLKKGDEMLYSNGDLRDELVPAYRIESIGKGKIAFIPYNYATEYAVGRSYIITNLLKKVLTKLASPVVSVNRKMIDISMQQCENGIFVNLMNMNQSRQCLEVVIYDEVAPIYDIEVLIKRPCKKVTMPLGEEFEAEYGEDYTKVKLKKLDIHSIISLED